MEKIIKAYCLVKEIKDYKTIRFLFDGKCVSSTMTADEVGLEDDDQIDAMVIQDGGESSN